MMRTEQHRPVRWAVGWLLILLGLSSGCVTTEALYAQYDAQSCQVKVVEQEGKPQIVRETVVRKGLPWTTAVYFALDSSVLEKGFAEQLDGNVAVLKRYPQLRVVLRGNADVQGPSSHNDKLAQARVQQVASYLGEKGIEPARLETVAYGEKMPLLDGADEQAHAANRRVELLLVDQQGRLLAMNHGDDSVSDTSTGSSQVVSTSDGD